MHISLVLQVYGDQQHHIVMREFGGSYMQVRVRVRVRVRIRVRVWFVGLGLGLGLAYHICRC